jgi:hypothetical protein
MKLIPIKNKRLGVVYAKVDNKDYEWLKDLTWRLSGGKNGAYARHPSGVYMHHLVLLIQKPPRRGSGIQIDHQNHDGLDNQEHNLHIVTTSFNAIHRLSPKTSRTGYRCVWQSRQWRSYVYEIRRTRASFFRNPRFAAMARELELRHVFGDNEACNFRPEEIVGASFNPAAPSLALSY